MRIEDIKISQIDIPAGGRVVDPTFAQALGFDMVTKGQQTAIDVIEIKEHFSKEEPRYRLIAGRTRVAGMTLMNGTTIRAQVYEPGEFASEAAIKLAEITENFMRRELTVLDRAYDVAAWRDIYEATQGAVKPGKKSISRKLATNSDDELMALSAQFSGSFTEASTAAFGLSRDAVFRSLKIARITDDVRRAISLHKIANNQSELLALSAEAADRQLLIANLLTSNPPAVSTVADAIAMLDHVPRAEPPAPWSRVSDSFQKLPEAAKRRVIEENWDFIEAMLAERKAA